MTTKSKPSAWVDPDDAPAWTAADFAAADYRIGEQAVTRAAAVAEAARRTRGHGKKPAKIPTTLRLPPDTLAAWKATGAGWQTRMATLLAAKAPQPKSR